MNFDILTGFLLLLLAGFYLRETVSLTEMTGLATAIGPKAFPYLLGTSMLVLSLLLLWQGWQERPKVDRGKAQVNWTRSEIRDFLVVPALIILYALVLESLGYLLSTLFFLLAGMLCMGRRKWTSNLLWALWFSLGTYFLFTHWLDVQLPRGPLPF